MTDEVRERGQSSRSRGVGGRAARYTLMTAPAPVLVSVAVGWVYGQYTELDRPNAFASYPYLVAATAWCAGATLLAFRDAVQMTSRRAAIAVAGVLPSIAVAMLFAPRTPIPQGAAIAGAAYVLPVVVVTAMVWRGALVLALRTIVAGVGLAIGVPAAVLVLLVAISRGTPLLPAAALAGLLVHLPVTFLTTIVWGDTAENASGIAPRTAAAAFAPLSLAVGALVGLGGIALRPLAPAERDPVLAEVAAVHRDLNSAVGWDAWRPRALRDTEARLDRAIELTGGAAELVDARERVRDAVDHDDRSEAVIAHRIIAGFERNVREARDFLASD